MDHKFFAFLFVGCAAIMMQYAEAQTTNVVGDNTGWVVPPTIDTYSTWASGKTFAVGDILTFNFRTGEHDVLQVPKASYDACTSDNPIGGMITTGPANITLTTGGDAYFICTIGRHCQAGQKMAISVSGTPVPSPPTIPSPPVTPSPNSSPEACPPTESPTGSFTRPELTPPPSPSSSTVVLVSFLLPMFAVVLGYIYN
ncbi:umecyanin-like [Impatiens glandulifera]|uniref:umecyanin-like n=1 Tax=Impatiens glandulifera TaxID=253017 RepID=UPI001FB0D476|nr:umecyanin-like [Impatiens glandulifera]